MLGFCFNTQMVLMQKSRLEAFSDGVIAILITLMAIELKVPTDPTWESLRLAGPIILSYILSFVFLGIYWVNHHQMIHAVKHISPGALWANLHLLLWLSFVPYVTGWIGKNPLAPTPLVAYCAVLLFCGLAYKILQESLVASEGRHSHFAKSIEKDYKGWASLVAYSLAIAVAYFAPWVSIALCMAVSFMWFIPDRRYNRAQGESHEGHESSS